MRNPPRKYLTIDENQKKSMNKKHGHGRGHGHGTWVCSGKFGSNAIKSAGKLEYTPRAEGFTPFFLGWNFFNHSVEENIGRYGGNLGILNL